MDLITEQEVKINVIAPMDNNESIESTESCMIKEDDERERRPHRKRLNEEMEQANDIINVRNKRTKDEIVSSLFNHNPFIPRLILENITPINEDVFSTVNFASFGIHPHIVKNLQDQGITKLTNVQNKAIPVLLSDKNVLIKSQTGSGKTLAYAIPILQKLQNFRPKIDRKSGLLALIIVPTRELALQTYICFKKLCSSFVDIVPGVLQGGEKKKSEKARLRKGINILVSTTGRLIDHIQNTNVLSFNCVKFVVLDEADRMLELGYERDVRVVLNALDVVIGEKRQTVLLSATLTTCIEQLSQIAMKRPVFVDASSPNPVSLDSTNLTMVAPSSLKQNFIIVPAKLRLITLASFLLWKCNNSKHSKKILVFMATQDMVDFHHQLFDACLNEDLRSTSEDHLHTLDMSEDTRQLLQKREKSGEMSVNKRKLEIVQLHGYMNQHDRMEIFERFRSAKNGILLCTDVAARGLDVLGVDWIVQYNPPTSTADYVHRIGRTARIGSSGSSLIFLLPSEAGFIKILERNSLSMTEMVIEQVLEKRSTAIKRQHSTEEAATSLQICFESKIVSNKQLHNLAAQAYVSFVRSYASFPRDLRDIFCFKALHLGHIAKSFGLRDAPSNITGIGRGKWVENEEKKKKLNIKKEEKIIKAQKKRIDQKSLIVSEFASGINFKTKRRKFINSS